LAYLNRFLQRGIRLRKRSIYFILSCFAYFQEGFLIEAIRDIDPLQNLSLLSGLIWTTGAATLLICSLLLVIANRKYSNLRIRKLQSNRIFVKKIATNLSEKYKNRFEFFHKKFSEIKSVIKALKNKKLVVLYLI
jgi:hypothetical protein